MTTAKFAAPGSAGAFADKIAWIDFGAGFQLIPGSAPIHVENALPDGFTVAFDISAAAQSGPADPIDAKIPPVFPSVSFGTTGYTGINGYAALYTEALLGVKNETIRLRNIVVKNSKGQATTTFDWIAADAEATGPLKTVPVSPETWSVTTDGSPWLQIDNLPPTTGTTTSPSIAGVGTLTVLETGIDGFPSSISGPVYLTSAPKNITATTVTSAQEGFAFGIIITARKQAINDLIESVALEQTAISHILDAEGKKIQAILAAAKTGDQVLAANASAKSMANSIANLEMVLQSKLELFQDCSCILPPCKPLTGTALTASDAKVIVTKNSMTDYTVDLTKAVMPGSLTLATTPAGLPVSVNGVLPIGLVVSGNVLSYTNPTAVLGAVVKLNVGVNVCQQVLTVHFPKAGA